jgi:outer membrane immunogenic protein
MKRIVFGAVLISAFLLAAPLRMAGAADLAVKGPPPVVPWVCTFCGWYAGVNVGYGITSGNGIANTGTDGPAGAGLLAALNDFAIPLEADANIQGVLGGGQIGYNWEYARGFLMGIEADFDGISAKKTLVVGPIPGAVTGFPGGATGFPPGAAVTSEFDREWDWFSTLRARFGVQVMNGSFMPYVTGGGAAAQVKISNQFICTACTPSTATEPGTAGSNSIVRFGGAVGAGFEWMIVPKFTVKAEYLYVEVGQSTSTITYTYPGNVSTMTSTARNGLNIMRAGINWYF